jgi:hypothetical protein
LPTCYLARRQVQLLGREDLLLGKSDEESALQFRLDVAKLNLMLSSPLQTGTGSSNSPRSTIQSGMTRVLHLLHQNRRVFVGCTIRRTPESRLSGCWSAATQWMFTRHVGFLFDSFDGGAAERRGDRCASSRDNSCSSSSNSRSSRTRPRCCKRGTVAGPRFTYRALSGHPDKIPYVHICWILPNPPMPRVRPPHSPGLCLRRFSLLYRWQTPDKTNGSSVRLSMPPMHSLLPPKAMTR